MSLKKILIIEDNPVNMELATDLLDVAGFNTVQAEDAEKGISLARREHPDLILMDIQLPGMDGLTATRILKDDPETQHLRIVALTAHAMKGDEEKALSLGCMGYITKPINTRSFSRLVAEFCEMPVETVTKADVPETTATEPAILEPVPAKNKNGKHALIPLFLEEDESVLPQTPTFFAPKSPGSYEDMVLIPVSEELPAHPEFLSPGSTEPVALEPMALDAVALEPVALEPEPLSLEPMALDAVALEPEPLSLEPVALEPEPLSLEPVALEPVALEPEPLSLEPIALDPVVGETPFAGSLTTGFETRTEPTADAIGDIWRLEQNRAVPGEIPVEPPVTDKTHRANGQHETAPTTDDNETAAFRFSARRGRQRKSREFVPTPERSGAKLLVADDDEMNREMITAQLRILGYEPVVVENGFQVLDVIDDTFDLVLLDYMMPEMDGCDVVRQIREQKRLLDIPIIMVTALSGREDQLRAVESGANDWITKPIDRTELAIRVKVHLKFKAAQDELKKHQRELEGVIRTRTADLRKAIEQVTAEKERTQEAYLDMMHRLAMTAEFRDGLMSAGHVRCIGAYCATIARAMRLPDTVAETLLHAAPVHDIGILSVPEEIVRKKHRTPEEEAQYRDHTVVGARLLSGARSELLRAAEVIALTHHEKWDGTGYPHQRNGDNIPLLGRICAVADAFDTMTAYDQNRWQISNNDARERIRTSSGRDFDPQVVEAFLASWEEILMIQQRFRRTEAPPEDTPSRLLTRV